MFGRATSRAVRHGLLRAAARVQVSRSCLTLEVCKQASVEVIAQDPGRSLATAGRETNREKPCNLPLPGAFAPSTAHSLFIPSHRTQVVAVRAQSRAALHASSARCVRRILCACLTKSKGCNVPCSQPFATIARSSCASSWRRKAPSTLRCRCAVSPRASSRMHSPCWLPRSATPSTVSDTSTRRC